MKVPAASVGDVGLAGLAGRRPGDVVGRASASRDSMHRPLVLAALPEAKP